VILPLNFNGCITLDDGSTGMEVAIKMALRLWDVRARSGLVKYQDAVGESDEIGVHMHDVIVLTQKDCYHGWSRLHTTLKTDKFDDKMRYPVIVH
jgi:hypothetical protein